MATYTRSVEVQHWAYGYASWDTTLAVVDDSGDGDADGIAQGDGSGYSANGDPLRSAFLQSGSEAATIRVEADVQHIGKVEQQDRARPVVIFSKGSAPAVWMRPNDFGGLVDFSMDSSIGRRHHVGMMHWVGMDIQVHASGHKPGMFSSTAGAPSEWEGEPYLDARVQDIAHIDTYIFGGWDQNTDSGPKSVRESRHYRVGMHQLLGARIGGFRDEQGEYHSQIRGVYRAQASEFFALGRSAIQLVARGGEADGRAGYGSVVIESVRIQDVGCQNTGFPLALKGRNAADLVVRDVTVAQGCNPFIHPNYQDNIQGAIEFSLSRDVESDGRPGNPERINWNSVLIDGCSLVRGTAFQDPDSILLDLGCCGKVVDVRATSVHEYGDSRPAIRLGLYDVFNPNGGVGERKVDLFRFDVNNDVQGQITLYGKPGEDALLFQTYAEFLAHIDGLDGFEVYDSTEDGDEDGERLTIETPIGERELRPHPPETTLRSGDTIFTHLEIAAPIGEREQAPLELEHEFTLEPPISEREMRPLPPEIASSGDESGGGTGIHITTDVGERFGDPMPPEISLGLTLAPPLGERISEPMVPFVLSVQDTEDPDPPPRPPDLTNPLLGLFPPGALSDRCEVSSVKWRTTKALDTILREVEQWVEQWVTRELNPETAEHLLPEWLEMVGIPEPCLAEYAGNLQRQRALVAGIHRMHGESGLAEKYFVAAMKLFGFSVTITYPRKPQPHIGTFAMGDALWAPGWNFVFEVHVSAELANAQWFTMGSAMGTPLYSVGNAALECLVQRFKPAHTKAVVVYDDCAWNDTSVWDDADTWDDC